jgi:hypothetical protein
VDVTEIYGHIMLLVETEDSNEHFAIRLVFLCIS